MKKEPDKSKSIGILKHDMDTQLAEADHVDKAEHEEPPQKRRRVAPTPEKASAMKGYIINSMESILYDKKNALLETLKGENQNLIRKMVDNVPQEFDDWKKIFQGTMEDHYIKCFHALDEELISYIDGVVPMM